MLRVRAFREAELPLVLARGVASARDQLVGREVPLAREDALRYQFHTMYRMVLGTPGSALLVAEPTGPPGGAHLPAGPSGVAEPGPAGLSVTAEAGPVGHALLLPQANPFTGVPEVVVMDIWVHPDQRSRGIGSRLLAEAERHARQIGARGLVAQIALHNAASLALFHRAGFAPERVVAGKGW